MNQKKSLNRIATMKYLINKMILFAIKLQKSNKAWYINHIWSFWDLTANIEIAKSLFNQNKYLECIDICNQILANNIQSIDAIKLIAKSFLASRKIENALLYFNKAIKMNPDDYESMKDLGNIYLSIGEIDTLGFNACWTHFLVQIIIY